MFDRETLLATVAIMEQLNQQASEAIDRLDGVLERLEAIARSEKLIELHSRLDRIEQSINRTKWA